MALFTTVLSSPVAASDLPREDHVTGPLSHEDETYMQGQRSSGSQSAERRNQRHPMEFPNNLKSWVTATLKQKLWKLRMAELPLPSTSR